MSMLITKHEKPAAYLSLSDECKRAYRKREEAILEIQRAERGKKAAVVARWASRLDLSSKRLQNLCTQYTQLLRNDPAEAWRVFLDAREFPEDAALAGMRGGDKDEGKIPRAALRQLRIWLRGAVTAADAWEKFRRVWRQWLRNGGRIEDRPAEMAGWESCPPDTGHDYPAGCARRTFERLKKQQKIAKWEPAALQRGLKAITASLAHVASSRVETWPGAIYEFDDMWHNKQVLFADKGIVRVAQFGVIDTHSGCFFYHALKPRVPRADGTFEDLNEAEFRWFVAEVLMSQGGYDAERGTILRVENAKAALREDMAELLYNFTGGKIVVDRAAIQNKTLLLGGWGEGGGGNPHHKPLVERFHEIIQRKSWELAGDVGRSVEERPAQLAGMYEEQKRILAAIQGDAKRAPMAAYRAALLRNPFPDFHLHFAPFVQDVYQWINEATEHEMEGWLDPKLNYVEQLYRFATSGPMAHWFGEEEYERLNEAQQAELAARIAADWRGHTWRRKLSRGRVWRRGKERLTCIRPELACAMIARDFEDGLQEGQSLERTAAWGARFAAGGHWYESRIETPGGEIIELSHAEKYQVIPFGDRAFIRDLDGRYQGVAALICPVNPLDREQVERAMGHKATRVADQLAPLREDHAEEARAIVELKGHNRKVIAGEPVTKAERAAVKDEAARKAARAARLQAAQMEGK